MHDARMTLPDGRTMSFIDIGAPDGPVVVYLHGAPGSRLEPAGHEEEFLHAGVRVISPDRPGYGGSTPLAGRTTADFANDVAALADHLGIDRFAVLGISSGGPYAVACAAILGDRVSAAIVAAGNTDMSWPEARDGYMQSELDLMAMDDEAAAVAWCESKYGPDGSGFLGGNHDGDPDGDPGGDHDTGFELGPVDTAFLADESNLAALFASMGEAFIQGVAGYAHDITVQGREWSFDPAAITARTIVVHGADDQLVPMGHSRHTAELIPGAVLRVIADCGHLSLIDHFPALAAEVTGQGGDAGA